MRVQLAKAGKGRRFRFGARFVIIASEQRRALRFLRRLSHNDGIAEKRYQDREARCRLETREWRAGAPKKRVY